MMWGYYPGMGWWMVLSSLFWLALVAIAVWALVRWVSHQTRTRADHPLGGPSMGPSAEEILRQRYARREIDEATYEQMRERLTSTPTQQTQHPVGMQ